MGKQRDLQKLLELAQLDIDKKTPKVQLRILNDLIERFATSSIHEDEAEDIGLKGSQRLLASIIEQLHQWKRNGVELEVQDYPSTINSMIVNGVITTYRHWEEHIHETLLQLLNGIKKDDLQICPQCGNLFVIVGKKAKTYCSPRCGVDHHRGVTPVMRD